MSSFQLAVSIQLLHNNKNGGAIYCDYLGSREISHYDRSLEVTIRWIYFYDLVAFLAAIGLHGYPKIVQGVCI